MNVAPFTPGSFSWVLGIEDTCVLAATRGRRHLVEHALTDHDANWRADLDIAADLGARALRYGVDWPLVHVAPERFHWRRLDERLTYASEIGLTVIADLVHYGTPPWISASFTDAAYPAAIAEFASAFAQRYRGVVDAITPCNEPLTTASFAGLRGVWPPRLTGWRGWVAVTLGLVDGALRTVESARNSNPDVVIVHVEASSQYLAGVPEAEAHAQWLAALGYLPTDLLLGRVDDAHQTWSWLVEHGADPRRLEEIRLLARKLGQEAGVVDILGVNYYPALTPRTLLQGADGLVQVATNRWTSGLRDALNDFGARYQLPMVVAETSVEGTDEIRSAWLRDSVRVVRELRAAGADLRGYTWWPLLDFVDWSYASAGANVEEFELDRELVATRKAASRSGSRQEYLRRMGLVRLDEDGAGRLTRTNTETAATFAELTRAVAMPSQANLISPEEFPCPRP